MAKVFHRFVKLRFDVARALTHVEAAAFGDLMETPESAGLRRVFRAERLARKLPAAVQGVTAPLPQRVAVWGAEGEGAEIARAALQAGFSVQLADPSREALVAALDACLVTDAVLAAAAALPVPFAAWQSIAVMLGMGSGAR
jgi:hypothetical protein